MNNKVKDIFKEINKLKDILKYIHEKLNINFIDFMFVRKGEEYVSAKVSNETWFKEGIKATLILKEGKIVPEESKAIFVPEKEVMYTCRALLQIQSVFFNMKDNKDDIRYYP